MGWLKRKLSGVITRRILSPEYKTRQREQAEESRKKSGQEHQVHYFHQIDDPYSWLTAAFLSRLVARYNIQLVPHLVGEPDEGAAPERKHLQDWSRRDVQLIAPAYGLEFCNCHSQPPQELVALCGRILANLLDDVGSFADRAFDISQALWCTNSGELSELGDSLGEATDAQVGEAIEAGVQERQQHKHYLGATFYYAGEWYWGVDRLHYLEARLAQLNLDRQPGTAPLCPPQDVRAEAGSGGGLQLEFYPSLRSPYTAIVYTRLAEFCERLGVELIVRPVLPMVMRGLPVPPHKGRYILGDVVREAQRLQQPFGNICDPVGKPVERVYSLYPWVQGQGKGFEWLKVCSTAAWAQGLDLGSDKVLRELAESIGLDWAQAPEPLADDSWREMCETNQAQLDSVRLWGVPSFRLLGLNVGDFEVWGQDRLWLLEQAVMRRNEEHAPFDGDTDTD